MFETATSRRKLLVLGAVAVLAGCQSVPKGPPLPPPDSIDRPSSTALPTDRARHRVAMLVPLSGPNAAVGESVANAATMALLDTNADNLRITNYDTAAGAAAAANRAIADGNKLILGPLLSNDIPGVAAAARNNRIPVVSYSNDALAAGNGVFVMGNLPGQSITRTVQHARANGITRFAALVPEGDYGQRASAAFMQAVREAGGTVTAVESYNRAGPSLAGAARRLKAKGGYEAVMIADGGRMGAQAAPLLKSGGAASPRLLGTELWSGENAVATTSALRGAWYSALSDGRYRRFAESYRSRFGTAPHRLGTLGYDSVLLALRVARNWRPGTAFPLGQLDNREGFVGLDGAFRFRANGVVERAYEIREVRAGGVTVISPAPDKF